MIHFSDRLWLIPWSGQGPREGAVGSVEGCVIPPLGQRIPYSFCLLWLAKRLGWETTVPAARQAEAERSQCKQFMLFLRPPDHDAFWPLRRMIR